MYLLLVILKKPVIFNKKIKDLTFRKIVKANKSSIILDVNLMFKLLVNFHETVVKDRRMPVGYVCPSPLHHLTLLLRHRGRCCSRKLRQTSASIRHGSRTKWRRCVTAAEPTPIVASPWRWPDTKATVDALSCVSQSSVDIIVKCWTKAKLQCNWSEFCWRRRSWQ